MNDVYCKICNQNVLKRKFKSHLNEHSISQQDYYNTYFGIGLCATCNKPTKFNDVFTGYNKYCSRACLNKSKAHTDSVKHTKLIRYGDPNYVNPKKISNVLSNRSEEAKQRTELKRRKTKLERYGSETYNNSKKYKETCLNIYGTTCPFAAESVKHKISDKYQAKSDEEKKAIYAKRQATFDSKTEEEMKIINQKHRDAYILKSDKEKAKIKHKSYLTKKKNHSFKVSKIEDLCYTQLLNIYPDAKHGYKSIKYPFVCDLYIPSKDIYIELNFHWTHGGIPYDGRKSVCKQQLAIWKEKAKTSKYFKNAINTWTIRDTYKLKVAKHNKIQLLVFYTKSDFDTWLSMQ